VKNPAAPGWKGVNGPDILRYTLGLEKISVLFCLHDLLLILHGIYREPRLSLQILGFVGSSLSLLKGSQIFF